MCTSLFASCCQPYHGKVHGVDYMTSLLVPCHGKMHGVDYSTALFIHVINYATVKCTG